MGRSLSAPVAAEKDLKFNRPFLSAVFHFGGSVGDIFVADQDITINGTVHKGIVRRWGEFRSVIRPRDGSFQLGKMDSELSNAPLFGVPAKRFSDLWTGLAPEAVEVDLYQNFLSIADPATVLQDKIHRFVMSPVDHTPERAKIDLISASEKYLDKKEISFPLSDSDFPSIKRSEMGQSANLTYGATKYVRAHQVKGFPTSPLPLDMDSAQAYVPVYKTFWNLLPSSGRVQVAAEQIDYTAKRLTTITAANLVTNGSATNAASYATASITPTADRLVLAWIGNSKATTPDTPTLSGNGLTWVQVATVTFSGATRRLTLFRAMGAAPTAGAVTIDFGGATQTGCEWSISEYSGVDTSGTNGSGAVVQSASNSVAAGTSLSVTLAAFASVENATAAGFSTTADANVTPGSGFTEVGESGHATPASTIQSEFRDDADTTADATFASADAAAIAVEIGGAELPRLTGATRAVNTTDADLHGTGDTVVFFPTELIYLAEGRSLKSIPKVYVRRGEKFIPVKPSRYTVELANTTLVSGKTLSIIKFTVPPLNEERLYLQKGTTGFDFGGQDKTKSSGRFKYRFNWRLTGATNGADAQVNFNRANPAHANLVIFKNNASGVTVTHMLTPYECVDDHFHAAADLSSPASGVTLQKENVELEYKVATALDDPVAASSQREELVHVQEATGGEFSIASGGTSASGFLDFAAQEKPKSSGKFRYYRQPNLIAGDLTNLRGEIKRHATDTTEDRILMSDFGSTGLQTFLRARTDKELFFEDEHYHDSNATRRFEFFIRKKSGTAAEATFASIGQVRVEYNIFNPAFDPSVEPLLETTTADLVVGGDVYFDCEGPADDGSGTYTGTANALIEKPADVVRHLLTVPGAVPASLIDAASFQQARADLPSSYKLSGVVTERSKILKEALLALCGQSSLKVDFAVDKFTARALKASYSTPTKTITEKRIAPGSFRVFAGPLGEVINKGTLRYARKWYQGRSERAFSGVIAFSDSTSITKYGERKQDNRFWFDFIDVDNVAMAQDQADFWKARLKDPPRMVQLRTYLDEYEVLPGDVRGINYLMPDGVEHYDGLDGTQKFLAEEVAHVMGAPTQGSMRLMDLIFRQVA